MAVAPDERRAVYEQAIQLGRFDIASLRPPRTAVEPGGKITAARRSRERDGTP